MITHLGRTFLIGALLVLSALAQDRGTITGSVTDGSGGSVPGAIVTVRNPGTNISQNVTTDQQGGYTLIFLSAGRYDVTVEKQGFRKADVSDVVVNVNTTTRLNVALQVGAVTESVNVQSEAPLLQTDRSDLGLVITNKQIQDLPLFMNGGLRSNIAFALLAPGANASITGDPDTTGGAPRIAGGQAFGNSLLLDGGESMSERRNDPAMRVVSAEGIEEFKVQSGGYSAEFGRSSNGVLNYTTKSGTNALHGSAFVGIRNEDLNAQGFFYSNPSYTIHRQNLEAATIGGPVWIPKVYDGRNKAFFFFSGERSRAIDIANAGLISLPIQDFRNGDFRRYTNAAGVVPLYDPFDSGGNIIADANQRQRLQCNGVLNVICPQRINPIAAYILKYIPSPGNPNQIFNNTLGVQNGTRTPGENQAVYAIKGDYNISTKLHVNGLFSRQYFNSYPLFGPVPGQLGEGFQEFGNTKWVRFNADYVASSSLLNHFNFGYNQRDLGEQGNQRIDDTYRQTTLAKGVSADKAPNYTVYQTEFGNYSSNVSTRSPGRTFNMKDQVAWLKGRHNLKMGMEWAKVSYARLSCNNCVGSIGFSNSSTGNPSVNGTTGINYASFLLGVASGASFNYGSNADMLFDYYAWYIQDDFKLNRKLTLNIGLRYDLPFARYEADDQLSNFNPTIPNPGAGGLLGALEFAGSGPGRTGSRRLQQTRMNAFGPRLGFAYQLTSRTVLRGGGAVMYDSNREDGNADSGIQGFGGSFGAPGNYYSTGVTYLMNAKGFDQYGALVDASRPPKVDPTLANNQSPDYKAGESGRAGYFTDYNFTIEHSLTPSTVVRAAFHANYGIKFLSTQSFNQLDPKYIAQYGTLLNSPISSPAVIATGFRAPYANFPVNQTLGQALRPYPQYNSSINGTANGAHSTYNALETSLEHRFSKGLYTSVAYTFSKLLANVNPQNVYDRVQEKTISGSDRPHILAVAYIYELPFGRGKKFGNHLHPALNAVLGNWKGSAVHRYQSGTPFGISASQNLFGANFGGARASLVPGQPLLNPNWDPKDPTSRYVNKDAFFQPVNGVYGNTSATLAQLRQPNQLNEDVALSKVWNLGSSDKRTLEFRGSAFNIANRHLLGGANTNISSSTFGLITNPQTNTPRNIEFSLRFHF